MAILTKAQLEALNQSSFPDQSTEAITPAILRNYNTQTIDTLVDSLDTGSFTTDAEFNAFTSSTNSSITQLNASSASQQVSINALNGATSSYATSAITASSLITASVNLNTITFTKGNGSTFDVTVNTGSGGGGTTDISSLNAFTASQLTINSGLNASTASQQISIDNLNTTTASINSSITQLNASSASQQISINALNTYTTSVNTFITSSEMRLDLIEDFTQSAQISINNLNAATQSLFTSASLALTTASFSGNTLTFTKGNGTTFGVVIPDVSGSGVPAGTISGSQQITNLGFVSSSVTASSIVDIFNTIVDNQFTYTKGDGSQQTVTLNSSGGGTVPAGTISGSQQITDLGFVSSSVTASSLVTASFSGNTLTFTKGDASTFGVVIPDVSGSAGTTIVEVVYTGENITKGDPLYISGSQGANPIVFKADAADAAKMPVTFISNETIGVNNTTNAIVLGLIEGIDLTGYTAGQTIYVAEGGGWSTSLPSGSNSVTQLLGVVTKEGAGGKGLVLNPGPAQLPGLDSGKLWVGGANNQPIEISSASFATTGSNVFTGDQTLSDGSGNNSTISPYSGSFALVAKTITSGSAGLSHITSSANLVNLVFKSSNQLSGSLTISGSSNIINSPSVPTTGFRKQVNSNNIMLTGATPEITSSVTFPVSISNNYTNNIIRFRGPVSSSAWSFSNNIVNANFNFGNADGTPANQAIAGGNVSSNVLLAAVNYNAYTTPLVAQAVFQSNLSVGNSTLTAFSSSIAANNNIFVGNTFTVNNRYYGTSSTAAAQRLSLQNNVFGGLATPTLTAEGSNTTAGAPREVHGNTTNGAGLAIGVVLSGDNSNLYSTLIHGSNLTVTGSNAYNTQASAGSTFIGRNNSVNGTAARSGETIFAVGTGTGTGARKTGFLIDSGSNTFVEGTLNVSGSTSFNGAVNITGSLTSSLTEGYVWVGGAGNITTLAATSSFGGGSVPAGTVSSSAQITAFGFISSSTIPEGTVSSSAQILGYNIFATTGSNTFNGVQTLKNALKFEQPTGGSDNFINLASVNESTLYIQNTSVSSGYQSGSVLQITENTGSNGYGFSGSAVFQMDALYNGNSARMQVGALNGVGGYINGFGDTILFAKQGGFPNTPATTFRVDAASIELSGSVKMDTGSSGSAGIVNVNGSLTVNNGLVTSNSIILVTTQNGVVAGTEYPAVVTNKTNGSFEIHHNYGGNLSVGYLIINPI